MVNAIYRQANMSFLAEKTARMHRNCWAADRFEVASNSESKRGMRTLLISCRLPKADIALLRVAALSLPVPFRLSFGRWISLDEKSFCGRLGSSWFTERFHRNALVTHFQHG